MAKLSRSVRYSEKHNCQYCGKEYMRFHSNSESCSADCYWDLVYSRSLRARVLSDRNNACDICKNPTEGKLFVRWPKEAEKSIQNAIVFCPYHNAIENGRIRKLNKLTRKRRAT